MSAVGILQSSFSCVLHALLVTDILFGYVCLSCRCINLCLLISIILFSIPWHGKQMLQTDSFEMTALPSHGALGLFKCTERSPALARLPHGTFSFCLPGLVMLAPTSSYCTRSLKFDPCCIILGCRFYWYTETFVVFFAVLQGESQPEVCLQCNLMVCQQDYAKTSRLNFMKLGGFSGLGGGCTLLVPF